MKILIDELSSNYDFFLISPEGKKINEKHMVLHRYKNFILRGKQPFEIMFLLKDMYKAIKKVNPSIIHIQMPSTLVLIYFLLLLGLLNKNVRIIYTDRGVYGKYGKLT